MLSFERQSQIIDILRERQCATVGFLCEKLFASGATIRRDLALMEEKGLIQRVRGGAALMAGNNQDAPLLVRVNKERDKKEHIARLALQFITDSATLFMDSSSTVTVLAQKMDVFHNLSIVTNGVNTMNVLNERTTATVYACGGVLKNNSSMAGALAVDFVKNFCADILFFSCCGLSVKNGSTEAIEDNAAVKKSMCLHAKKKIMLCDSTKFSSEYFCKVCDLRDLDVIITDKKPDDAFLRQASTRILY